MGDTTYTPGTFNEALADRALAIMNRARVAELQRRYSTISMTKAIILSDTDWAVLRSYARMMAEFERPDYEPAFTPQSQTTAQDKLFGIPVMPRSDVVVLYETEA